MVKKCYVCKESAGVEDLKFHYNLTEEQYDKLTDYYYLIKLNGEENEFYNEKDLEGRNMEEMEHNVVICKSCVKKAIKGL